MHSEITFKYCIKCVREKCSLKFTKIKYLPFIKEKLIFIGLLMRAGGILENLLQLYASRHFFSHITN